MKVSLFNLMPHPPLAEMPTRWPTPHELCDPERAVRQLGDYLDQFALADELGFDWVACAEHHFSANSLSPCGHAHGEHARDWRESSPN